ncbi:MAG: hypothetical protein FJW96_17400 [Actinobacteria bacterium]|nr:hypothetical protein [Actinomycetota bacterium]
METGSALPLTLEALTGAEIDALLDALEPEEQELSQKRRRAHARIDHLRTEVQAGIAELSALVPLEIWERRLSAERRALHACMDALYDERARRGIPPRPNRRSREPEAPRPSLLDRMVEPQPVRERRPMLDRVTPAPGSLRELARHDKRPLTIERPARLEGR